MRARHGLRGAGRGGAAAARATGRGAQALMAALVLRPVGMARLAWRSLWARRRARTQRRALHARHATHLAARIPGPAVHATGATPAHATGATPAHATGATPAHAHAHAHAAGATGTAPAAGADVPAAPGRTGAAALADPLGLTEPLALADPPLRSELPKHTIKAPAHPGDAHAAADAAATPDPDPPSDAGPTPAPSRLWTSGPWARLSRPPSRSRPAPAGPPAPSGPDRGAGRRQVTPDGDEPTREQPGGPGDLDVRGLHDVGATAHPGDLDVRGLHDAGATVHPGDLDDPGDPGDAAMAPHRDRPGRPGPPALAPAREPDPEAGVAVPLATPLQERLRALAILSLLVFVCGVAVASGLLLIVVAITRALSGL